MAYLLLAWLAVALEFKASLLDGRTVQGQLVELSPAGVLLETPLGRESLPAAELAGLEPVGTAEFSSAPPRVWVELIDGSRLAAHGYSVSGGRAVVSLVEGAEIRLPAARVAAVRLRPPEGELAQRWQEIAAAEHTGDVLVVRRQKTLDFLTGVLGDVDEEKVAFKLDGERLSVRRNRIEGWIYFHPPAQPLPKAFCRLATASGHSIEVQSVQLPRAGSAEEPWQVTTPAGVSLRVAAGHVARIEFAVQYLSDLEPERANWSDYVSAASAIPVLAELYAPRRNRGFLSNELQLDGRKFAKGLALRSRSELVWRLAGTHRRLTAIAGIDDAVRPRGSVRLVIQGDARTLLETTLTGQTPPLAIDLDISGVRRLLILVDFGDDLDISDFLNICDARLID
jgi:hypothetical protein